MKEERRYHSSLEVSVQDFSWKERENKGNSPCFPCFPSLLNHILDLTNHLVQCLNLIRLQTTPHLLNRSLNNQDQFANKLAIEVNSWVHLEAWKSREECGRLKSATRHLEEVGESTRFCIFLEILGSGEGREEIFESREYRVE